MQVFLGGSAGMLYNALWYYPVLMVAGGCSTLFWDLWGQQAVKTCRRRMTSSDEGEQREDGLEIQETSSPGRIGTNSTATGNTSAASRRPTPNTPAQEVSHETSNSEHDHSAAAPVTRPYRTNLLSWKIGAIAAVCFFTTFIPIMILRGTLKSPPRGFSLFANLYLAGTIIFGGGPVVIPLLREYVVNEGWVSARDFLLGLAVIQAFPGPNFNFAVYLGTLAVFGMSTNAAAGAVIGYVAIFMPGLALHTATMSGWSVLRKFRVASSAIRGINAAAVGLVYTAIYRLWQIEYLGAGFQNGSPLGGDPWWVVVVASSFVLGR